MEYATAASSASTAASALTTALLLLLLQAAWTCGAAGGGAEGQPHASVGTASGAGAGPGAPVRRVHLRCGADHMAVAVDAAPDFEGVVYTRGSFHERRAPCFLSARAARASRAPDAPLTLRFPLHACHTKREADTYSNVVVVQADEELVMPGDAAFALQCDFSRPRDVTVGADLSASSDRTGAVWSRISLVEADPAADALGRRRRSAPSAANASDQVQLLDVHPSALDALDDDDEDEEAATPRKDEL